MSLHREIKSLTGLRGVAACYVMLYHFIGTDGSPAFVLHGYLSVDLFFVLSGFVMALTYAREFQRHMTRADYLHFLGKRIARVYPAYLLMTLLLLAFAWLGHGPVFDATGVVANLLMLQAWGLADSVVGPAWSISTEFAAYVAFPLLLLAAIRSRSAVATVVGLVCVATIAWLSTLTPAEVIQSKAGPLDIYSHFTVYPVLRCMAGFTLGMLSFRMLGSHGVRKWFERRHAADAWAVVVLAALAVPGTDAVAVLCFVPLLLALAVGSSYVGRLLSSGVAYWLGLVSYSVYLIHQPIHEWLGSALWPVFQASGVPHAYTVYGFGLMVPVLALATVTYYLVEKPGRNFLNARFRSKPHITTDAGAAAATGP